MIRCSHGESPMAAGARRSSSSPWFWALVIAFLLHYLSSCEARILSLSLKNDTRRFIVIDSFGFTSRGHLEIEMSEVSLSDAKVGSRDENRSFKGFFLATEEEWVHISLDPDQWCVSETRDIKPLVSLKDLNGSKKLHREFCAPDSVRYSLIFANCQSSTKVSMNLRTSMYNLESKSGMKDESEIRDYLSVEQAQQPKLYMSFFIGVSVLGVVWIYLCLTRRVKVHRIHILMGALIFLKALYFFSHAGLKAHIKRTGTPQLGWNIVFSASSFLKDSLLLTLIVLIGTGWSLLKPDLEGKGKEVLMLVIPLQMAVSVAEAVIRETGPFFKGWVECYVLMLVMDAFCCCAALFAIVWSINSRSQQQQADNGLVKPINSHRQGDDPVKPALFRQYFITVLCYFFFTRFLLYYSVPSSHYTWINDLTLELASLLFYISIGYMFRPLPHGRYYLVLEELPCARG